MKLLFCLLLALTFTGKTVRYVNERTETGKVYYSKNVKLKWADFRQANLTDASANSSTAITYDYQLTDGKIFISVYCTFYKAESFYKKGKATAYLLNHEQRHFDITYVYAMELVDRLKSTSCNTEEQVVATYNQVIKEWEAFEDEYDKWTDNSQNKELQGIWDKRIDNLLTNL